MIAFVYRKKRRGGKGNARDRMYRGRYRIDGDDRVTDVPLRTPDKTVAQTRLHDLIAERQRERAGLLPPRSLRDAAAKPLKDHLADYVGDLRQRGRDGKYVEIVQLRTGRLFRECGWVQLRDISADGFVRWRAAQTLAAKTLNEYLGCVTALLNWMAMNGRIQENPLKWVQRAATHGREVRIRRALTDEEIGRLLAASGPRRALYTVALYTGLRRGELSGLRWSDVDLDGRAPCLRVRASIAKNHKSAVLPLHADAVAALSAIRPEAGDASPRVFPRVGRNRDFREDLKEAGIVYIDEQGRRADFHALRHTFCTNLQRAGVSGRVAMEVMRHSDLRLTMRVYTDASQLPTTAAIHALPSVTAPPLLNAACTQPDVGAQTGPQRGAQETVPARRDLSLVVTAAPGADTTQPPENKGESHDPSQVVTTCPDEENGSGGRARTYNLGVNSALLYH